MLLQIAACNPTELESSWCAGKIVIDGKGDEWDTARAAYFSENNLLLAVANDFDNLYLRLSTTDFHLQRQLMQRGCTIWFDADGGENKVFGLRFPLPGCMMPPPPQGQTGQLPNLEQLQDRTEHLQSLLEILQPTRSQQSEILTVDEANRMGIYLQIALTKGSLIYEVKIPYRGMGSQHPFVVAHQGAKRIGVGFVSEKTPRGEMPQGGPPGSRPDGPPGGFGSGRGGGPGGDFAGGRMPPHGAIQAKSFELWTKVNLAVAPP
ncbi:MAG: hypothetical protein HY885_11390 [Deltaproteobacteria bacterium]|nr:hypothetical protein [Deltaproteobacteria bacterium]